MPEFLKILCSQLLLCVSPVSVASKFPGCHHDEDVSYGFLFPILQGSLQATEFNVDLCKN